MSKFKFEDTSLARSTVGPDMQPLAGLEDGYQPPVGDDEEGPTEPTAAELEEFCERVGIEGPLTDKPPGEYKPDPPDEDLDYGL